MQRSDPQYSYFNPQSGSRQIGPQPRIEGWLFDIDELGPWVTLWVYDDDGGCTG